MASQVECVVEGRDRLGECPLWDERAGALWWVDILGLSIKKWDGSLKTHFLPESMGSFAFRERGGLIAAMKSGLYFFNPENAERQLVCSPEKLPANRFNDGRCDRAGRFWAGTMVDETPRQPAGALYRLSPSLDCAAMRAGVTIPNSLAWSPDGRTMYFADTPQKKIFAFDYDAAGQPANERIFAATAGFPDGSCVDAEGCLWNAEYGGWRVVRYTPAGKIDRVVELPVANPTCCCFGGAALDTLYITTAAQHLKESDLARQPLAGSLFAARPVVKGLPESRFAG
jgi:sugar lactone lactonase YvrE